MSAGKALGKIGLDFAGAFIGNPSLGDNALAPDPQRQATFSEPGAITDPKQSLSHALQMLQQMGMNLSKRSPTKLRSSYVQAGPAPVSIPGLPFQIGGGLGRDPALDHPELLTADDRGVGNPGAGVFDTTQRASGVPAPLPTRTGVRNPFRNPFGQGKA